MQFDALIYNSKGDLKGYSQRRLCNSYEVTDEIECLDTGRFKRFIWVFFFIAYDIVSYSYAMNGSVTLLAFHFRNGS